MLWSIGKDSTVLLWLARKAFFGHVPFPLVHIDTAFKIPEMIAYRDRSRAEWKLNMIYGQNEQALRGEADLPGRHRGPAHLLRPPQDRGAPEDPLGRVAALPLQPRPRGLRAGRQHRALHRRHRGRARRRGGQPLEGAVFLAPQPAALWDVGDQPPEFWNQYKTEFAPGTHVRIHPLLDWTELNIWEYIERENIPTVSLYYDQGAGTRYRSLGCWPCTQPVESTARNVHEIIEELRTGKFANIAERVRPGAGQGRWRRAGDAAARRVHVRRQMTAWLLGHSARRITLAGLGAALLWWLGVRWGVPLVIRAVYAGWLPFLDGLMAGRDQSSVETYLALWQPIARRSVVVVLTSALLALGALLLFRQARLRATLEPAAPSPTAASAGGLLLIAVWLGIVTGLGEAYYLVLRVFYRQQVVPYFLNVSQHAVWMSPLANMVVFAVAGGGAGGVAPEPAGAGSSRARRWPAACGLGLFALAMTTDRLHWGAAAVLSLGVATQMHGALTPGAGEVVRLARRSLGWLVVAVVLHGVGVPALELLRERRQLAEAGSRGRAPRTSSSS